MKNPHSQFIPDNNDDTCYAVVLEYGDENPAVYKTREQAMFHGMFMQRPFFVVGLHTSPDVEFFWITSILDSFGGYHNGYMIQFQTELSAMRFSNHIYETKGVFVSITQYLNPIYRPQI